MLDGGSQPLSVGGDDAAAGKVTEHDCMVGTSNRERLARTRRGASRRINALLGPRPGRAPRYVRQWNDKQRARVLAALPVLMITEPCPAT